jgi:hypothetical protein
MKNIRRIFLVVGLIILGIMLFSFGVKKPVQDIITVGWKFFVFMFIYFLNQLFLTYGWRVLITMPLGFKNSLKLLAARIAGDSTTLINAAASTAGDALKAMYIQDVIPIRMGLASVVLDRMIHILGNILFIILGIFIAMLKLDIPLYILGGVFAAFTASFVFILFLIRKQRHGFLMHLVNKIPKKIKKRFIKRKTISSIKHIDEEIKDIFKSRTNLNHFYISLFMHTLPVLAAGSLEVYFIMEFTGTRTTVIDAMFIYLFGLFITTVIFFMPGNVGTSEGSYSIALKYLGYDPALGIAIGMLRRLRAFLWSLIGIGFLFYAGLMGKEKSGKKRTK